MSAESKPLFRQSWNRFLGTLRMLRQSEQGPRAVAFAVTLVVLMLGINALNVLNSYVGRDFMSAIQHKDMGGFQKYALLYAGVFVLSTLVAVLFRYTEERLGILWREQLTWRLTESYLSDRIYHRLDVAEGVANPDQRITEDVRAFTTTTLSFLLLIVNGSLTALSFSGVLWSISPLLFGVAVVYAVCGSALAIWLGRPLIQLNYDQLDMEADFRADLIHVRENAESIALAHREGRFKVRLRNRLDALSGNFRRLIRVNRNLGFFTNGYNYFIQIIPALIIAPLFIQGKVEFGVITQSTMAFATLLGAFSLIVTQFQSISAFTAVTARLTRLSEAIETAQEITPCSMQMEECQGLIRFEHVTLRSADQSRVLLEELTLEVKKGSRWLVTAPDDAAKLALFRATAGVWACGSGRIVRPSLDDILFLPERPYLPPGALRDVLLRTGMEAVTTDEDIMAVLAKLGLVEAVTRVGGAGAERDWNNEFSIGEQHLLSIARILLARPSFVLLDRPGSALQKKELSAILDLLDAQGLGVIVLAKNGESELPYDFRLEIQPEGKWRVRQQSRGASDHEGADHDALSY